MSTSGRAEMNKRPTFLEIEVLAAVWTHRSLFALFF